MDSWQQLTEILSKDYREELAKALLEALAADQWHKIEFEIRYHRIHSVNITRKNDLQELSRRDNNPCKS